MVARNGITVTKNGDECSSDEKKVRVNLKILFFHNEKENLGRVENDEYGKFENSVRFLIILSTPFILDLLPKC